MFHFANPDILYALIAIPLLALLHYGTNYVRRRRLLRYGDTNLLRALMPDASYWRLEVKFWLVNLALASLIICLARPQKGLKSETSTRYGIEAIIALDVSNSMLAQDVSPSRLDKSKMLISNMVEHMAEDKVGLVVYAGDAFTQLPLTTDYVSAQMFLDNITPALIPVQGTDIARAITLAAQGFTDKEGVGRAIFVITDGEDNEGGAVEAARKANEQGILVFVLGVGSPDGAPIPQPSGGFIVDNEGKTVVSHLNEQMCQEIAQAGGGAYIYVSNSSSAQSTLQEYIDKMQKGELGVMHFDSYDEHFPEFAWAAIILLLLDIFLLARKNQRLSRINLFSMSNRHIGILLAIMLFIPVSSFAQSETARRNIRDGNKIYRKAVDLGADTTVVKRQQSLFSDALTLYKKAVEQDPRDARAYYNLGNACMMTGQLDSAMANFDVASKLETNKLRVAHSFHNMGVIRQQQHQFSEAIEHYKDALRRNPDDDETRYNLALCLHQLKKQQQEQNQQQQQQQDQQGGADKNKQKDDKSEEKSDQQKQEQQKPEDAQKQPAEQKEAQPVEEDDEKMSRENAEQMLEAAKREEQRTQDKVNRRRQLPQRRQLEKQW